MTRWYRNKIKHRIFVSYVFLLIIPLAVAVFFHYWKTVQILEEKAEEQFYTVTSVVNQQFEQYFIDIQNLSMNIFGNSIIQEYLQQPYLPPEQWTTQDIEKEEEIREFLNGIYNLKPGISSIIIYSYNGMHQFYHPVNRWDYSVNEMEEAWFKRTEQLKGRWVLSGRRAERQLFHPLTPEPEDVVTVSRLIRDVETFQPLGVLAINIKIELIKHIATLPDPSSQLLILDHEKQPVVASANIALSGSKDEVIEVSSISPLQWETVYRASKPELIKESRQIRDFMLMVTLVLSLVALVFAQIISRGIVKPLHQLREKMKDVERGQFAIHVQPVHMDEVGELTLRFNQMVRKIKHLVEEIQYKEKQKTEIELNAMQARINPHFMYNTLNGIRWVAMMEGNTKLVKLIESFVYLLKFSAKNKDPLISIENEVALLRHYIELMQMRNDQFDFHIDVQAGMEQHLIIPFVLQPIVENSIFHGIVPMKTRGTISVELYTSHHQNVAVIRDNGVGMESTVQEEGSNFNRIGLGNVIGRLQLQFGIDANLTVKSELGCGTEVTIQWPILTDREA